MIDFKDFENSLEHSDNQYVIQCLNKFCINGNNCKTTGN